MVHMMLHTYLSFLRRNVTPAKAGAGIHVISTFLDSPCLVQGLRGNDRRSVHTHLDYYKNGHILPYVHFEGGKMSLRNEAKAVLRKMANAKG